jgi:hypothetical protein
MTEREKQGRALRRRLIKRLVATDDLFDCRTVDKESFADKERERLKRKKLRKEQVKRETAEK